MKREYPTPKYKTTFVRPSYSKIQKSKPRKSLILLALFILLPWFTPSNQGKVIYAQPHESPPPMVRMAAVKLLKPLQMPHVEALQPLQPVWVDKTRPIGTYANSYAPGNCTWYVASRLPVPQDWGNANTWDDVARSQGLTVSPIPKVGEIAQNDWMSYLGHVAIVEAINPVTGMVTVSEMNVNGLGVVDTATYPIADWNYIYI